MNDPLFVSYYTPDYAKRAKVLLRSLNSFGLEYDVREIPERGSWQKDSQFKAKFVWDRLVENFDRTSEKGRPIVWLDADAEVLQRPVYFFNSEADIGVCEYKHPQRDISEVLSGTIYFRNAVKTHRVVDAWIEECNANPDLWDQKCLRKALNRYADDGLRMEWLPISYCFIFDTHRKIFPETDPVIVHYQESRQAKMRKPTV